MVLSIGKLKKVVRFDKNTPVASGAGFADAYTTLLTTRGYLKKRGGNRNLVTGEIENQDSYELYVRYQDLLEANLRVDVKIVIEGVTYTIETWEKIEEKNEYFKILVNRK